MKLNKIQQSVPHYTRSISNALWLHVARGSAVTAIDSAPLGVPAYHRNGVGIKNIQHYTTLLLVAKIR